MFRKIVNGTSWIPFDFPTYCVNEKIVQYVRTVWPDGQIISRFLAIYNNENSPNTYHTYLVKVGENILLRNFSKYGHTAYELFEHKAKGLFSRAALAVSPIWVTYCNMGKFLRLCVLLFGPKCLTIFKGSNSFNFRVKTAVASFRRLFIDIWRLLIQTIWSPCGWITSDFSSSLVIDCMKKWAVMVVKLQRARLKLWRS